MREQSPIRSDQTSICFKARENLGTLPEQRGLVGRDAPPRADGAAAQLYGVLRVILNQCSRKTRSCQYVIDGIVTDGIVTDGSVTEIVDGFVVAGAATAVVAGTVATVPSIGTLEAAGAAL